MPKSLKKKKKKDSVICNIRVQFIINCKDYVLQKYRYNRLYSENLTGKKKLWSKITFK